MHVEKLIDCVRQYSELYDIYSKRYNDVIYKENVWRKIEKEIGFPGENKIKIDTLIEWIYSISNITDFFSSFTVYNSSQ